jgi:hypothetical protein
LTTPRADKAGCCHPVTPERVKWLVRMAGGTLTNSRMRWGGISSDQLERAAHAATIIGVPLVLLTILLGYFQTIESNRAARLTNYITLVNRVFSPANTQIIDAIENWKPILAPAGKFTEAQLDNYLTDFETIDEVYEEGLLSESQLCMFSYYIILTANSKEISDYIKKIREAQSATSKPFFIGYYRLVELVEKSRIPDCR